MSNENQTNKDIVVKRFNEIAEVYDKNTLKRQKYNDAIDEIIIEFLQSRKEKSLKILDAGCGTGMRAEKMKRAFPTFTVDGFDICENMIKIARTKDLNEVTVQDISKLSYPNESYDAIMCLFSVIAYLDSKQARKDAAKELFRALKPGGILFIDVINRWHLGEGLSFKRSYFDAIKDFFISIINPKLNVGDKLFSTIKNGETIKGFFHGFTNKEMIKLLEEAGFKIVDHQVIGYDSGKKKDKENQGQLFYIAKKTLTNK